MEVSCGDRYFPQRSIFSLGEEGEVADVDRCEGQLFGSRLGVYKVVKPRLIVRRPARGPGPAGVQGV